MRRCLWKISRLSLIIAVVTLSIVLCIVLQFSILHMTSAPALVEDRDTLTRHLLTRCPEVGNLAIDRETAMLAGQNINRVFLTIGIPSVYRPSNTSHSKTNYVISTVKSLISNLEFAERREVVIVIFLADIDRKRKEKMLTRLTAEFDIYLHSGLVRIITAPPSFYPSFDGLKRTFGDNESRVKWRSKQNYDYAFLWSYSAGLSDYYMQLEDDVTTIPGYLYAIKSFIAQQVDDNWVCLEFSTLGYIGKLYRSETLPKLAKFTQLFFQEYPVDFILRYFNNLLMQTGDRLRIPTIFQHHGYHSSLKNKTSFLTDVFFDDITERKLYNGHNPPANVLSNMDGYGSLRAAVVYNNYPGYFWARQPKSGQYIEIVFHKSQNISRFILLSGSHKRLNDYVHAGILEFGWNKSHTSTLGCGLYAPQATINTTLVDVTLQQQFVSCIRVTLTKDHDFWIILKEIAVFITS